MYFAISRLKDIGFVVEEDSPNTCNLFYNDCSVYLSCKEFCLMWNIEGIDSLGGKDQMNVLLLILDLSKEDALSL
ncbi:hypothetical protein UFOVP434_83 [uncultured Caudovirales phage]|uniref:Uncharacterized protein n=1 Tax=uncultured Caudovirales phage TaxID=2100421 RepID=A0A6J5MDU3_9CAUD|nr:hypothetical protein UFOVP434_83 [uncultured Caudovirales phage]